MVKGGYIFGNEEEARQVLPGLCTLFQTRWGTALSGVLVASGG